MAQVIIEFNAKDNTDSAFTRFAKNLTALEKMGGVVINPTASKSLEETAQSAENLAKSNTRARETIMALSGSLSVLQNALGNQLSAEMKNAFDSANTFTSALMIGTSLAPGYGTAIGGALGAIAAGYQFINAEQVKIAAQEKAVHDALVQPFVDAAKAIDALTTKDPLIALSKQLDMSTQSLRDFVSTNARGAQDVKTLNAMQQRRVELLRDMATTESYLANKEAIRQQGVYAEQYVIDLNQKLAGLKKELLQLEMGQIVVENDLRQAQEPNIEAIANTNRLAAAHAAYVAELENQEPNLEAIANTNRLAAAHANLVAQLEIEKSYQDALKNLAKAQADILKGAINNAMMPTQVTDEDMQAATMGKYADKWDETVRRVKTGNLDQFGKDFADRIRSLGMPLEDVTRKFQNFSLFANGDNLDLINFDALNASVAEQLDALIGEAKVKEAAFQNVVAKMSPDKQKKLQELGIMKLSDADQTILKAKKADDFDKVLADAQKTLLETFPKEMETTIFASWAFGKTTTNTGDTGGNASAWGGTGEKMAEGGYGIARQGQLFMADAGEAYWFSGKDHTVPPPSTGSSEIVIKLDTVTIARAVLGQAQKRN